MKSSGKLLRLSERASSSDAGYSLLFGGDVVTATGPKRINSLHDAMFIRLWFCLMQ